MRPTIPYVERKFHEFNNLIFGGKLPPIPFRITSARSFAGQLSYYKKRNPDGSTTHYGFIFKVSNRLDLPEDMVEDTIIHEMIHYYILFNGLKDTSSHGPLFRRIMAGINKTYNRKISISHRRTSEESDTDTQQRLHIVCLSRFDDNEWRITCSFGSSTLFKLWDTFASASRIEEFHWFVTADPYFNRIPRARTPKFYALPAEELRPHLKEVNLLIREGQRIISGKKIDLSVKI